jgi:TrmH family RNA methyltransferase
VRRLRRLAQKRALRWSEGVCVLEGPDLVEAALAAGCEFEGVYLDGGRATEPALAQLASRADDLGVRVFTLQPGVLERVADAQTPQPVLGAVRFIPRELSELVPRGLTVVLHDVRDPGNAGAVIRTADAAGAAAVVLSGHSVDPYNPKTLRATAGSIFHLPVVVASDLGAVTGWFAAGGGRSYATVVRGGTDYRRAELSGDVLVVVGNEGEGLDAAAVACCDESLSIPMAGANESLNVAVAAGVVVFEALAQRRERDDAVPRRSIGTP